ncbi:MAG: MarR family transcriptional regulator [Phycisphaerales bacterium]|nr:MarR family transcriptional regulator [Phycisphaerales bacterium]
MQLLLSTSRARGGGVLAACAHEVLDTVPPVIWFIRKQMRERRRGLSLPQFRTLATVDQQPAVSLSVLADHLGSSLPTASRIVEGLVKKGLLTRKGCDQDRRQCALGITASGKAVLLTAWRHTHAEMGKLLIGISAAERETVSAAMKILSGLFGSAGLPEMSGEWRRAGVVAGGRRMTSAGGGKQGSTRGRRRWRPRTAAISVNKFSEV